MRPAHVHQNSHRTNATMDGLDEQSLTLEQTFARTSKRNFEKQGSSSYKGGGGGGQSLRRRSSASSRFTSASNNTTGGNSYRGQSGRSYNYYGSSNNIIENSLTYTSHTGGMELDMVGEEYDGDMNHNPPPPLPAMYMTPSGHRYMMDDDGNAGPADARRGSFQRVGGGGMGDPLPLPLPHPQHRNSDIIFEERPYNHHPPLHHPPPPHTMSPQQQQRRYSSPGRHSPPPRSDSPAAIHNNNNNNKPQQQQQQARRGSGAAAWFVPPLAKLEPQHVDVTAPSRRILQQPAPAILVVGIKATTNGGVVVEKPPGHVAIKCQQCRTALLAIKTAIVVRCPVCRAVTSEAACTSLQ
jgi:LSD1 subclass zinc finger protein